MNKFYIFESISWSSIYIFSFSIFQIILILGFVALAAAKSPTLSLHNSLEPPLDYIPVNSGADIKSSKIPSGSKPVSSSFPGPGYLHPLCPNGSPPPCDRVPETTCPNGKPPPCTCPAEFIGTPPHCRARPYLIKIVEVKPQCKR